MIGFREQPSLSPLHNAVIADSAEAVDALIEADPSLKDQPDSHGITPYYLAQLLGRDGILSLMNPGPKAPIRILPKGERTVSEVTEKEFTKITGVTYTPTLRFPSYKVLCQVMASCPWWLLYSPLGKPNRWQGAFYRREILDGAVPEATIRWIDEGIGYGLFADAPIPTGDFVIEYTGLVHRRYRITPNTNDYCLHYPSGYLRWRTWMIDSLKYGNYSRFLNHSDTPNLTPICVIHTHLLHMLFRANRPIAAGEELTFDYGADYWRRRPGKRMG